MSHLTDEQIHNMKSAANYLDSAASGVRKAIQMASAESSWEELHDASKDMLYAEQRLDGIDYHLLAQFSQRDWARRARGEL